VFTQVGQPVVDWQRSSGLRRHNGGSDDVNCFSCKRRPFSVKSAPWTCSTNLCSPVSSALFFNATVNMELATIEKELNTQASASGQRKRAGHQALPPELPRIEHHNEPPS
jgi:hypothetical protein